MPTLYTVIRRPLITEKGMTIKEAQNTLVFEVALKSTKTEVKQAVESLFKIKETVLGRNVHFRLNLYCLYL